LYRKILHTLACAFTAAVLAASFPAADGVPTGRIAGHVKLTAKVPGTPLASTAYPRRAIGRHDGPAIPEIRNVVVYLKNVTFRESLPPHRAELRQQNETFVPHVVAVTRGSTVDFPNDDPFFHNVFSLSGAGTFNLGRYPQHESKARTFTKPGTVKVFCDIHSHMSATILVFDHPYFTIPDFDGSYELPAVPAGQYTIVGWHERVGERVVHVTVDAGKTTTIDLDVPVGELP